MAKTNYNEIKENILNMIAEQMQKEEYLFTDALRVGPGSYAFPILDQDRNEIFALVEVSIPKGTRKNGTFIPYDGYQAAADYAIECDMK